MDSRKGEAAFVFAGLWDSWRNPQEGDVLNTFTIITTDPNALVRRTHNRMPVIYDEPMGRQWLDHDHGAWSMGLAAVLRPWPAEYMAVHDVSTLVNSPENDTPECIKPLPPGYVQRGQLPLV